MNREEKIKVLKGLLAGTSTMSDLKGINLGNLSTNELYLLLNVGESESPLKRDCLNYYQLLSQQRKERPQYSEDVESWYNKMNLKNKYQGV
jgi:hypothetical protein